MLLAEARGRRRRGAGREGRRSRRGGTCRSPAARGSCSRSASCSNAHTDEIGADRLLRARQGARGREGRGHPRHGGRGVRLRHPAAAQGRVLRPGLDRRRRPTRSASRSACAPGSRRSTSRSWCRCGCTRWRSPCGNTFVLKPSERDPSVSNFVAELYAEAGLPDGVFNVVHGDKVAVDALLDHPDVAAVSFVGSTPIASYVYERATAHGKRVQALGGAKNHAVVMPDADLDFTANQLTAAGFGSAGQRCMAISVAVAVGDAADPLVERLREQGARGQGRPGPGPGVRDGAGRHAGGARADRRLHRPGREAGADVGRRRPRAGAWTATASGSARRCSTRCTPEMARLHATRSSARCSRSCGSTRSTRRSRSINAQPVRQRRRDLHLQRPGRAPLPARGRRRHDRHQRPDPGADGLLLASAAGRTRCSATTTSTAPRACASTPAARRSPAAGPRRRRTPATTAATCTSRPRSDRRP